MSKYREIWSRPEHRLLSSLRTPRLVQDYLLQTPYNIDDTVRSPRGVMAKRKAHCFDGAIFAAAALYFHGAPPLLVDVTSADNDDDHVLAVFRRGQCWGAISKSNYPGLGFREPIYRSLRELMMSYFELYFNLAGEKTLRAYSRPLDLRTVEHPKWLTDEKCISRIEDRLNEIRHYPLISRPQIKGLTPVDNRTFKAGTLGVDKRGAFKLT